MTIFAILLLSLAGCSSRSSRVSADLDPSAFRLCVSTGEVVATFPIVFKNDMASWDHAGVPLHRCEYEFRFCYQANDLPYPYGISATYSHRGEPQRTGPVAELLGRFIISDDLYFTNSPMLMGTPRSGEVTYSDGVLRLRSTDPETVARLWEHRPQKARGTVAVLANNIVVSHEVDVEYEQPTPNKMNGRRP